MLYCWKIKTSKLKKNDGDAAPDDNDDKSLAK